jgi:hypothetical protein
MCHATIVAILALTVSLGIGQAMTAAQPKANPRGFSAAALFNQANACALAGRTGLAIVNCERALLLAPPAKLRPAFRQCRMRKRPSNCVPAKSLTSAPNTTASHL